ncbi:MAG: aminoacyl-tRNA hydrolase [Desulfuromonadia bacterium]
MESYLIAGLGNPGPKYQGTRHNAGFMVLDRFAHDLSIPLSRKQFSGEYGQGGYDGVTLHLLKPLTYMNLSGRSVAEAVRFFRLPVDRLIVIHDEIDLPFGHIRVKEGGGHGGHNGLRSLIQELSSAEFIRIRVGIGRSPGEDTAGYVLSPFPREQQLLLPRLLDIGSRVVRAVIDDGAKGAMNLYNGKDLLGD